MITRISRLLGQKIAAKQNATALHSSAAQEAASRTLIETFDLLGSSCSGLTYDEVEERLQTHGLNEVTHGKHQSVLNQLWHAFANPFVAVLLVLALISYFTDVYFATAAEKNWSAIIIMVTLVFISGVLRFVQEFRSNIAAEKLKAMVVNTATVVRRLDATTEPTVIECPMSELVVGDIIQLQAGDMIPADIRLIESRDLFINQAALTGESLPVEKYDTMNNMSAQAEHKPTAEKSNLLDLDNICFMGTNVISGRAKAIVIATGADTFFGSLARNISSNKRIETSFDKGVNSISWLLIRFMLIMVPIVFIINGLTKGDWLTAFSFSLAVAVGITPEMLPMIVSTNLAKGAVMMAKRKVVVKRINAVQNLGAMDVLCTDKTGTLTQDEIILEHYRNLHDVEDKHVLELAWLNSAHQSGMRNLMDMAIVNRVKNMPEPFPLNQQAKVDELPFDFIRRRLSVILRQDGHSHILIAKGAVEEMLSVCSCYEKDGVTYPLDEAEKQNILHLSQLYNDDGFRVLLLATRVIDIPKTQYDIHDENHLCVRGILTFLDPPKDSAAEAIRALQDHGVAVKVLTGDNFAVAAKVCRQVGLEVNTPITGNQIDAMNDAALAKAVAANSLFAKLTPLQKSRIVKTLQAQGHTVGFLGDGINDAPALHDADVGISVDSGTDIAKETADIILLEKSLMVLEEGVIKGRETFGNILKYLNMTASSNFGNVLSVLVASAWLPWEPMLAMQLLILNLIYDVSQMALPWDRMDADFLKKPRQWDAGNIGRFMIWIGPTSSVFDITTYILLWTVFGAGAAYYSAGGDAGQNIMNTGWFIESLISQTLVVHMLRTRKIPFLQSTASLPVLLSTALAICTGCILPYTPLAASLGFVHLPLTFFLWMVVTMVAYMCLSQWVKNLYIKRFKVWY